MIQLKLSGLKPQSHPKVSSGMKGFGLNYFMEMMM